MPRLWNGNGGVSTAPPVVGTIWSQLGGSVIGHVAWTAHFDMSSVCWAWLVAAIASARVLVSTVRQRLREPPPQ